MQVAEKPVATMTCETCGVATIRTVTAKHQRPLILDAEPFSESKVLTRYRLTDKGARQIDVHSQMAGEKGFPRHVCRTLTLAQAEELHPDLKELRLKARDAALAVPYRALVHDKALADFHARLRAIGVRMSPFSLGWGADSSEDVNDPGEQRG